MPPAGTLLVCLPPSGAGRSYFAQWPRRFAGSALLALSRPGHEERLREPLPDSLAAAAADVADRIRARAPRRAVVFGHSLGAAVGFEAVRLLERDPIELGLIVSARQAPHLPGRAAATAGASDAELLATLAAWGGPAPADPAGPVAALLLASLRADLALSAAYRWDGRRSAVPLVALAYAADRVVDAPAVAAWREAARGDFSHLVLAGDHGLARTPSDALVAVIGRMLAGAGVPSHGRDPSPPRRSP